MNRTQLFDFVFFTVMLLILGTAVGIAINSPETDRRPQPATDDAMDWYLNPGNPVSPLSPSNPGNIMNW